MATHPVTEKLAKIRGRSKGMGWNRKSVPHPVPDLDFMDKAALEQFIATYSAPHGAKLMWPTRPRCYTFTTRKLLAMAGHKLNGLRTGKTIYQQDFERKYRELEPYAQWRQGFNVQAAIEPGKKFRKHPPKPKPTNLLTSGKPDVKISEATTQPAATRRKHRR